MVACAYLLIFLPLLASLANRLLADLICEKTASIISGCALVASAICASILFIHCGINKNLLHILVFSWIKFASFTVNYSIYIDQVTAIMFLLITYVSSVVHIYSVGYMHGDKDFVKFLSYLSLFTFCMLSLVCADNFVQLFFGWEGVGFCSYLLIGYYFHKNSANVASVKAFLVNRVGDFALILGIVIIFMKTGSVEYNPVFVTASKLAHETFMFMNYEFSTIDVICFLLFVGCMGKSAQIGLHVWLPDAMEGPTPVSALIHAATMVTAGVFLVTRCSFLFEYSSIILNFISVIGAVTCVFAATIAVAQDDIKKIIAYSTCSQLGYMFLACGSSAYNAAMFHLVTHGFFKALLFLGAGSVIHATHKQNIFELGGLKKKLAFEYMCFWIGSLAIMGIFPFAGFYSKDLVLESAYGASSFYGYLSYVLGLIAAVLTAVYSMKIILITFCGNTNLSKEEYDKIHASGNIMNVPLFVLIFGAIFSGAIGYYLLDIASPDGYFSGSILVYHHHSHEDISQIIKLMPMICGFLGILIGYYFYKSDRYKKAATAMQCCYQLLKNKYYFDEIYDKIFVKVTRSISEFLACFDREFIDKKGPGNCSLIVKVASWCVCQIQTGYLFNYVFYIIFALVFAISVIIYQYLYWLSSV